VKARAHASIVVPQDVQGIPPPGREAARAAEQAAGPGPAAGQVLVPEPAHAFEGERPGKPSSLRCAIGSCRLVQCLTWLSLLHGPELGKNQLERQENARLKHENDKLRVENLSIREAIRDLVCSCCGGPAVLGELSPEEHQLRLENARLRDELARVCTVTSKFIGKPMSHMELLLAKEPHPMTGSSLELAVAVGVGSGVPSSKMPVSTISELAGSTSSSTGTVTTPMVTASLPMVSIDKSKFAQLAVSAMNELVKMARMNEPLWIPTIPSPGSPIMETLNFKEYLKAFSPCVGVKPTGFVSEASRESGIVTIDSSAALMEVFMDEVLLVPPCSLFLLLPVCLNSHGCLNYCHRDDGQTYSTALLPRHQSLRRSYLVLQEAEMVHCCL
jgi:hypothetical protein